MATPTERADKIKRALEAIRERNAGRLTREAVVKAVEGNPRHPLRDEFEWNERKAAHEHRLARAQELITQYVTIVVVHKSQTIKSPYYVRDPRCPPKQQGHVALTDEELNQSDAAQIVLNELNRCEGAIGRARNVAAVLDSRFPGLLEMLESMMLELVQTQRRLAEAA